MYWGSESEERLAGMTLVNVLLLLCASILGGTLNGVAGGGSFITFPTLIYTGVPPRAANATSTTGLWPGSVSAAWALRKELLQQNRLLLLVLIIASIIGGIGGAILLLNTPQKTFVHLIPYLMLIATLLFAISPLVIARLKRRALSRRKGGTDERDKNHPSWLALSGLALLQLIIAIYGGYFGGGIGILMLASLGLMGMENIHEMNAVKNTLATCINGVAVIIFILAGAVVWLSALIMVAGTIVGSYGGVYYARKLDPRVVRGFVILVGCVMTLYFFYKYGIF